LSGTCLLSGTRATSEILYKNVQLYFQNFIPLLVDSTD